MNSVLIVGAGGLGCPVAWALARADVPLALVDDDRVDVSNLHRQILHRTEDVGRCKVDSAKEALLARFTGAKIEALPLRVTADNALELVARACLVVDGTDSVEAKFLLNDACVSAGVPLVHGAAAGWSGQLMSVLAGGPCYRCLFEAPPEAQTASCSADGILGPVAGVTGALMAEEALRILAGRTEGAGALRIWDGRTGSTRTVRFRRRPDCEACAGARRESFQRKEAASC